MGGGGERAWVVVVGVHGWGWASMGGGAHIVEVVVLSRIHAS